MTEPDGNLDHLEEDDEPNLLGHDPVLGPSDPEADEHGDNLTGAGIDEELLGENQ